MLSLTLFSLSTNDTPTPTRGHNITYADSVKQIIGYAGQSKEMARWTTATAIEQQNTYRKKWNISTIPGKFTLIRLAGQGTDQIITDTDVYEAKKRTQVKY